MRTQVAIIGAGPSGLLLGQLLHARRHRQRHRRAARARVRARAHPRRRARAGRRRRCSTRPASARACTREGLVHDGIEIAWDGGGHRIDLNGLTGGKNVVVYGQTEVTRDLMDARRGERRARRSTRPRTSRIHGFDGDRPIGALPPRRRVATSSPATSSPAATASTASAAQSVPAGAIRNFERVYPFGWLGLLSDTPPVSRRAHLRAARARLRAVQHAQPHPQPLLPAVLARRARRAMARRALLGRAATPARPARGRRPRHRALDREEHRAAAQLRRRADALRPPVPRRRRRRTSCRRPAPRA